MLYRSIKFLLLATLLPVNLAKSNICLWILKKGLPVIYPPLPDLPTSSLTLEDGRTLHFQKLLGEGRTGRVQRVENLPQYPFPVTVKYSRRDSGTKTIERELAVYNRLIAKYPKLPRFVVPILEAPISDERGVVLIKPELHGTPLEKLIAFNIPLSKSQLKSLIELREWAKTIDRSDIFGGRPIDLNPMNLVWVNDPNDLVALGLNTQEPTFVLYEVSRTGDLDPFIYETLFYRRLLNER